MPLYSARALRPLDISLLAVAPGVLLVAWLTCADRRRKSRVSAAEGNQKKRLSDTFEPTILLHLLEVIGVLRPKDVFAAFTVASRAISLAFSSDVRRWVAQGRLWPPEGWNGSSSSDIENIEANALRDREGQHLERLFLRAMREGWGDRKSPPRQVARFQRGRGTMGAHRRSLESFSHTCPSGAAPGDELLGGPVLWSVRRTSQRRAASEVTWLLRWKADANEVDQNGWTPLIWAASRGSPELCTALLKGGADVNCTGKEGSSALGAACRRGSLDIVDMLLAAGANPDQVMIGNGNLDNHVGDKIMELLRRKRQGVARKLQMERVRCNRT